MMRTEQLWDWFHRNGMVSDLEGTAWYNQLVQVRFELIADLVADVCNSAQPAPLSGLYVETTEREETPLAREYVLKDDLDGSIATQTIPFAVRGKRFEIDLNDKNAAAFDKALEKYILAGHPPLGLVEELEPRRARGAGKGTRAAQEPYDRPMYVEWASQKGYPLKGRPRLAEWKAETGQ